ncbi:MAG: peptide chain release factor N(5)-glutamine methyltransferase [Ignavibacteria bacterium]
MQTDIPLKITDLIALSTQLLKDKGVEDARLNVELMLSDVMKCDRMKLYLDFEKPLTTEELKHYKSFLKRRLNHEPVQYILGKTYFYGFEFIVNKNVLIPRPETELLVEKIIEDIKISGKNINRIFEIGAGSGCISISIAKDLKNKKINYEIFSIDNSDPALDVAKENLKINISGEKNLRFYKKSVFEIDKLNRSFDYIISNPPYISYIDYNKLTPDIKNFEPESSLTDNGNGLKFYEKIFQIGIDENFKGKIYCEIGADQEKPIREILLRNSLKDFTFYKDYAGINRIIEVRK